MAAVIFIIGFCLYFLPSLIAWLREHAYVNSITVINLFLGWTLIGWVVCLAWSLSPQKEKKS